MFRKWELYIVEVIRGRKKGVVASILRLFLVFFSWFYWLGLSVRKWLYSAGLVRTFRPEGPVLISIGNIVAGGTGKTPSTLLIAKEFYPDTPLAILSRGYRSMAEDLDEPVCLSKGDGPLHSALYCGDEPCLLVDNLPKALAYVGKNRSRSAQLAAEAGARLILIDDGMQHHKLERDFEVVVLDSRDPFGVGHLLPRGMLREEPEALSKADLIILNHIDSDEQYGTVREQVAQYSNAPTIGTQLEVVRVVGFDGKALESIAGKKVGIFCSIGKPDYFERTVVDLGAQIVHKHIIPDHKLFDISDLRAFAKECQAKGAELLVCTEKDKTKLVGNLSGSLSVAWVQIRLKVIKDIDNWEKFIAQVHAELEKRR